MFRDLDILAIIMGALDPRTTSMVFPGSPSISPLVRMRTKVYSIALFTSSPALAFLSEMPVFQRNPV